MTQTDVSDTRTQAKPYLFELRVAAMSAAAFAVNGIHLPFFPIWLDGLGMSASQIAFLMALPLIVRIPAAPAVLAIADRSKDRVTALVWCSLACCALSAGLMAMQSFAAIVVLTALLAAVWSPQVPLTDSIALSGVRRYGSDYANMRVWGSVAFLGANLVGGPLLQAFGTGSVPAILFGGFLIAFAISLWTPRIGRPRVAAPVPGAMISPAEAVFLRPEILTFIAAVSIVQASHAFLYAFGSIYWRSIGLTESAIGVLWAIGVLAEVLMFFVFRRLFGAVDPVTVLIAGGIVTIVRWLAFPLVEPLGFGLAGFAVLQVLHAFSFALTYLAMQAMIASGVEEHHLGNSQGIYTLLSGGLLAAGMFGSGPLYDAAGAGSFMAMAAIALAGVMLALAVRWR